MANPNTLLSLTIVIFPVVSELAIGVCLPQWEQNFALNSILYPHPKQYYYHFLQFDNIIS